MTRRRVARDPARRVSVVIPSWNTRDVTVACVERVRRHTRPPAEVLVVENGSTDGSAEAVAALAATPGPVPVTVLRNAENLGWARATNQGIRAARGRWVVLLNSDVLVTPGWLEPLLAAAADPRVGLVGPMTNYAGSVAQSLVTRPPYDSAAGLDAFAARWAAAHRGERRAVEKLVGFCLLVRRAALARIGLLDERFGLGNYDDDDLCRRARAAGWTLLVARESFVHHHGSLSFRANGVDHAALMRANERAYEAKWRPPASRPSRPARPSIALCMIARDAAPDVGRALASAAGAVDEMVVVDTGSTDDTPAIARAHGATVVHAPWTDDFAAARNVALARARAAWVLSLDADEALPAATAAALGDVVAAVRTPGLRLPVYNLAADGCPSSVHLALRLFARRPGHRFVGRVHERPTVAPAAAVGLPIVHHGYADPAALRAKLARNRALLEAMLAERDDPETRYFLAASCLGLDDHAAAARAAEAALAAAPPDAIELRLAALHVLARAAAAAGDDARARRLCEAALALRPDWIDARFLLGRLERRAGRPREAIVAFARFLADRERLAADPDAAARFPQLATLGAAPLAHAELALVHAALGARARARAAAERARRLAPASAEIARLVAALGDHGKEVREPWITP
ncbi:MAG TPA: glycosyltransferase [Candidatus Binatia bacterium]|nr:glycosyltransferase [Candidatus Binatia bacterium]